jgi:hypothetical protein
MPRLTSLNNNCEQAQSKQFESKNHELKNAMINLFEQQKLIN